MSPGDEDVSEIFQKHEHLKKINKIKKPSAVKESVFTKILRSPLTAPELSLIYDECMEFGRVILN